MRFHQIAGCFAAIVFAALFIAFLVALPSALSASPRAFSAVLSIAFAISLGPAIVLGLPLFLVLRRMGWANVYSSIGCGLIVGIFGFLLVTVLFGPDGIVPLTEGPAIVDGLRIAAQAFLYFDAPAFLFFEFFGALAGLVFWGIFKWTGGARSPDDIPQAEDSRRSKANVGLAAVAILITGTVFSVPTPIMDRTCHNMSYDAARGPQMVTHGKGPVMKIDLAVGIGGWPKLIQLFQEFGAREQLAFRNSGRDEFGERRVLALSLCNERGANIEADTPPWAAGVGISIYQLREGAGSIRLGKDLSAELERRWPGSVRFRDARGQVISAP